MPVLFASKSAIAAFRNATSLDVEARSVDNLFDDVSGNMLVLSLFLLVRTLLTLAALNLGRAGRSTAGIYSTSNALPDVLVCALTKVSRRSTTWVALVHHLPEDQHSNYRTSFHRVLSLFSYAVAVRLITRFADVVVAYHRPTIARLSSSGLPGSRLVINANGVDLTEIEAAARSAGSRRANVAVCIGRLSQQKGIPVLLRVWAEVSRSRPEARLTIVGAEDELTRQEVIDIAKSLGVADSILVRGVLPRQAVLSELLTARVMIAPSFVEGWGLSVLEGLACGTPVVGWDLEAYQPFRPAIVTAGVADASSFAANIIRILESDTWWEELSASSRNLSLSFSWDRVANEEWRILREEFGP
ncbi:MAG: glycosyltransferase [Thermoplasmata archaeon]